MENFNLDEKYLLRLLNKDPGAEEQFVKYFAEYLKTKLLSQKEFKPGMEELQQEILTRTFVELRNKAFHSPGEVEGLIHDVFQRILARQNLLTEESGRSAADISDEFTITFDSHLSAEQIKFTLEALADYYRACGGVGLAIEFELEEIRIRELAHV